MKKLLVLFMAFTMLLTSAVFAAPAPITAVESAVEVSKIVNEENVAGLASEVVKLTGTAITSGNFYNNLSGWNNGSTSDRVFLETKSANEVYVGYKLSKAMNITEIRVYSDSNKNSVSVNYERINGSVVQASVDGNTWVTLGTVGAEHEEIIKDASQQAPIIFTVEDTTAYNYVRFVSGSVSNTYFAFSEVEFYGTEPEIVDTSVILNQGIQTESTRSSGNTTKWGDGKYSSRTSTERVMFDNKIDAYAGYDYGYHEVIPSKVVIVPEGSVNGHVRLNGIELQGKKIGGEWETIQVLSLTEFDGTTTEKVEISLDEVTEKYNSLRIFRSTDKADPQQAILCFVELEFWGNYFEFSNSTELSSDNKIDSGNFYNNANTVWNDGVHSTNKSNYFFMTHKGTGNDSYVGYNLDSKAVITSVRVSPDGRGGAAAYDRISGAVFQGSNDNSSWTTLATVALTDEEETAITAGTQEWVTYTVSDTTAYKYVRFALPASSRDYFSFSEVEFYGLYEIEATFTHADATTETVEYPADFTITLPEINGTNGATHWQWFDGSKLYDAGDEYTITADTAFTAVLAPKSYQGENSIYYSNYKEVNGIRFKTSISNEIYSNDTLTVGFVVARASVLGNDELTVNYGNSVMGTNIVKADGVESQKLIYDISGTDLILTAVFHGIPLNASALQEKLVVRPFFTTDNQNYVYGNEMSRSIYDVAKAIVSSDAGLAEYNGNALLKGCVDGILTICGSEDLIPAA